RAIQCGEQCLVSFGCACRVATLAASAERDPERRSWPTHRARLSNWTWQPRLSRLGRQGLDASRRGSDRRVYAGLSRLRAEPVLARATGLDGTHLDRLRGDRISRYAA